MAYVDFSELEELIKSVNSEAVRQVNEKVEENKEVDTISCMIVDDDKDVQEILNLYIDILRRLL